MKEKKRPSGIVCRDFSLKPVGKLELVCAFFWRWEGDFVHLFYAEEETPCTCVSVGGWRKMLGTFVLGQHATQYFLIEKTWGLYF